MFSRFTEKAIQSIMMAQEEAKRFHHSYVGTEHIVLGIIGEGDNVVVKAFTELGFKTDQISEAIEDRLEYGSVSTEYGNIPFTQQAKQVLTNAWDEARKLGHNYVNVEHLFLSIFRDPTSIATRVLTELGVSLASFKEVLFKQLGNKASPDQEKSKQDVPTPTLDLYGRDLTKLSRDGKLDPVVGRSSEINRIVQILCRRSKNNPVLTGEPGVGKTAIVEGLAQKITNDDVPDKLEEKRVVTLDLGLLVAGTKYRGEFEDRVKKVMEEVHKAGNILLFVDELHTIIGTGGSEGSLDAANLFKPALARGELQCIGATTLDEYRKHIESDGALARRFQPVTVEEPSKEDSLQILRGIKARYEEFHGVTITNESLEACIELSSRYITDRFLPDKAVDLMDEASAMVMLKASGLSEIAQTCQSEWELLVHDRKKAQESNDFDMLSLIESRTKDLKNRLDELGDTEKPFVGKIVTGQIIAEVVSAWTGVPTKRLTQEESEKLVSLHKDLQKRIVGQDDAIDALVRAVKRSKVGLKDPKRPSGSFLFLGPTGVGKSELAKTLAYHLFGSRDAVIRIDMSEYMEKHTVSRLIGSPPGYVGFDEGGQLSEPVRRKPYSIVLFDELEKASPDVINIMLQILDDGRLTDSNGRTVNFKNTFIIMTSNVGSKFIESETTFGFVEPGNEEEKHYEGLKKKLSSELRQTFKPEFLNRIDDVVIFKSLTKKDIRQIVDIMLSDVQNRLSDHGIRIKVNDGVKEFLVDKGFDQKNGARPLRRAIQEHFEDKLADKLLQMGVREHVSVTVKTGKEELKFSVRRLKPPKPEESEIDHPLPVLVTG